MLSFGYVPMLFFALLSVAFHIAVIAAIWQVFQTRREVKTLLASLDEIRARLDGAR